MRLTNTAQFVTRTHTITGGNASGAGPANIGIMAGDIVLRLILMTTMLYYSQGIDIAPYMELLPAECEVRIDIVSRNNIYIDGYAHNGGRIIIYDGNYMDYHRKQYVLAHEIGHACGNKGGSYEDRERRADLYARKLLDYPDGFDG